MGWSGNVLQGRFSAYAKVPLVYDEGVLRIVANFSTQPCDGPSCKSSSSNDMSGMLAIPIGTGSGFLAPLAKSASHLFLIPPNVVERITLVDLWSNSASLRLLERPPIS